MGRSSELLIPIQACDARALVAEEWGWFLARKAPGRSLRPVVLTAFGDWFLEDEASGEVLFLDVGMGSLEPAAASRAELARALRSKERQQAWLLAGQNRLLVEAGVVRAEGQCYSWNVPPCVGGGLEPENFAPAPVELHQRVCSRMVHRFGHLPPGSSVSPDELREVLDRIDEPLEAEPARGGLPLGRIAAGVAILAGLLRLVF